MGNSDDYMDGNRYHLDGENPCIQFRERIYERNMDLLFEEFKINESAKILYKSKKIALGETLHQLLIE